MRQPFFHTTKIFFVTGFQFNFKDQRGDGLCFPTRRREMIGDLITAIVAFFQPFFQYFFRFQHLKSVSFFSVCNRDHFRETLEKVFKVIMFFDLHVIAAIGVKHLSHAIFVIQPVNFVKYFQ